MSDLAVVRNMPEQIERVLIAGDLEGLKADERVSYYRHVCESVGLNPLTKPFEYIKLNGKLTLYARRDATDQLRAIHKVSVVIVAREVVNDCYVVTAKATKADGRTDESIGAVSIAGLKGDNLCNAMMKAETKAKRRVTLSICGLGMLDETELETIPARSLAKGEIPVSTEDIEICNEIGSSGNGATAEVGALKTANAPDPTPAPVPAPTRPGYASLKQAQMLHIKFRDALPEADKPKAEKLLHDWLGRHSYIDSDGNPSAYTIPQTELAAVGKEAIEYASKLKKQAYTDPIPF